MSVRRVHGKLLKGNAMKTDPILRRHLPETHPYKPLTARKMMNRYKSLFIKPDKGSLGKGIIRIRRLDFRKVQISWGLQHRLVPNSQAIRALNRLMQSKKRYIIQQGLELKKYQKRKFDIRVYMQKPRSMWYISGKVVRVGRKGGFVTNYSQGATPKTIERVFSTVYKNLPGKSKATIRSIDILCLALAKRLDRKFPGIRELGIDIGIDQKGYIWIIEANTSPGFDTFKILSNKTMYYRIVARRRLIYSHP